MPNKSPLKFDREFKLEAVRRLLAGETVRALSDELKVLRKDLYSWRRLFRAGGVEALRPLGRPRKSAGVVTAAVRKRAREVAVADTEAPERIADLERKVGQQQIELDFFRQALWRVREARRPNAGPGATGSTRSSRR